MRLCRLGANGVARSWGGGPGPPSLHRSITHPLIHSSTHSLIPSFPPNDALIPSACHRYTRQMPQGEYLQYGGQAIFEGVMMRSPRYFSVACRAPNGEIITQTEALEKSWIGRQKWLKFPFLRGSLALFDAMGLGIKAMRFASRSEERRVGTEW